MTNDDQFWLIGRDRPKKMFEHTVQGNNVTGGLL